MLWIYVQAHSRFIAMRILMHISSPDCPSAGSGSECEAVPQDASHQLVMITGDTPLTACHAAKQVHIVDRPVLILDYHRCAEACRLPLPCPLPF